MILKASQRSGARQLAAHLQNARDNDLVELHGIRGLVSADDLTAALVEIDAQAQGTKCRKPFFCVAFNPPAAENPGIEQYEAAIAQVEKEFGLEEQARAVIFHEKNGRRHAHVVWSLIDTEKRKALEVKFFKNRLMTISRELYLEHGWQLPEGLKQDRRQTQKDEIIRGRAENYTLEEARHAERAGLAPDAFKRMVREAFDRSDGLKAFETALAEKGLYLANGDKGLCIVDAAGGVHALARQTGYRKKEIKARIGSPEHLPSVEDVQAHVQQQASTQRLKQSLAGLKQKQAQERNLLLKDLSELAVRHHKQRDTLHRRHWRRTVEEERSRGERLRGGIIRMFDRVAELLGKRAPVSPKVIAHERAASRRRDLRERDELRRDQRRETYRLRRDLAEMKDRHTREFTDLRESVMKDAGREARPSTTFDRARQIREEREARQQERPTGRGRSRRPDPPRPKP